MFYVYEYYIIDTLEVFYVGKGTGRRFKDLHNRSNYFLSVYNKYNCAVKIIKDNLSNEEACALEKERIKELRNINQARCNFTDGGTGFSTGELNPTKQKPHFGTANGMFTCNIDFKKEKNPFFGKRHTDETKHKISESRKNKGGRFGQDNPMYGSSCFSGENNPMYGKTGFDHPNSKMFIVKYVSGETEYLTSKQCEKKFGIAFIRIKDNECGVIHYLKLSKNSCYEGTEINQVETL